MPLLQTRQVRTGLPCHGCHGCVAMRCCISLATFHQTSSDCSIFQATRRCKGSSRRLHFRGGLVCTHTHTNTHMHSTELIAIPLYLNLPAILATGSTKVQTNMLEQDLQEHMHTSSASSSPFVTLLFICYSCNMNIVNKILYV